MLQWSTLAAWIAVVGLLGGLGARPAAPTRHVGVPAQTDSPRVERLPDPPAVVRPDPIAIDRLTEVGRRIAPAVLYVGHPDGDSGTAFVISRARRLLATSAHVADIFAECGGMVAVRFDTHVTYKVERVLYHPRYRGPLDSGGYLRMGNTWRHVPRAPRPDLAVLQLSSDGPDLPAECALADPEIVRTLIGQPIGLLGFSAPFPLREPTFKPGRVSLVTHITIVPERTPAWQLVDFSALGDDGDSGGPVFLPDGSVVAVYAWGRQGTSANGEPIEATSVAVGIGALWELLGHHGLTPILRRR